MEETVKVTIQAPKQLMSALTALIKQLSSYVTISYIYDDDVVNSNNISNTSGYSVTSNNTSASVSTSASYTNSIRVVPTIDEVRAYADETNSNVSPDRFFNYCNEKNWIKKSGEPIKDWKAYFDSWDTYGLERTPRKPQKQQKKPVVWNDEDRALVANLLKGDDISAVS